jgi:ribosomal protein S18 acetylase RimI-like enzyme
MESIQTDTSDPALVTAIRANLCDFFHYLGRRAPEHSFENDRFTRWQTPIAHPWFNGVLSSLPPKETDADFIEDSIQYFRARNIGSFTWWMEPQLQCSDWAPLLSSYGFGFSSDTPGMAMDLQTLAEPRQTVDGLEVRPVSDDESLRIWAHVFTAGYGLPADWEPSVYELERRLGLDLPVRNYLGYWNGKPVATSLLFIGGGVAGIYNVATLREARGNGVGAALTHLPLEDAREMGYRIGVLQSSELGYNVYKKLGFRHLCQIEYFQRTLS